TRDWSSDVCSSDLVLSEHSASRSHEAGVDPSNPGNGIEVRIDLWVIEGAGLFGAGFGSFEIGAGRLNDRMLLQRDLDGLPQSQKAAQGPALTGRLHRWLPHLRANRGLKPQTKDDE